VTRINASPSAACEEAGRLEFIRIAAVRAAMSVKANRTVFLTTILLKKLLFVISGFT
jgi:hypothetical protein